MYKQKTLSRKTSEEKKYDPNSSEIIERRKKLIENAFNNIISLQMSDEAEIGPEEFDIDVSSRFLDRLARLLDYNNSFVCTALFIDSNKNLLVSFNKEVGEEIKREFVALFEDIRMMDSQSLIAKCLSMKHKYYSPSNYTESILDINRINEDLKKYHLSEDLYWEIENYLEMSKTRHNTKGDLEDFIEKLNEKMEEIRILISNNEILDRKQELLEMMESAHIRIEYFRKRLLLDCDRIVSNKDILSSVTDVIFIENPVSIHAEQAMKAYLKQKEIPLGYIGISKLCCFMCDIDFALDEVDSGELVYRRGGSGLVYPDFKVPARWISDQKTYDRVIDIIKSKISNNNLFDDVISPKKKQKIDASNQYPDFSSDEDSSDDEAYNEYDRIEVTFREAVENYVILQKRKNIEDKTLRKEMLLLEYILEKTNKEKYPLEFLIDSTKEEMIFNIVFLFNNVSMSSLDTEDLDRLTSKLREKINNEYKYNEFILKLETLSFDLAEMDDSQTSYFVDLAELYELLTNISTKLNVFASLYNIKGYGLGISDYVELIPREEGVFVEELTDSRDVSVMGRNDFNNEDNT